MRKLIFAGLVCVALGISSTISATLTVSNTNDSGPGSLRDAIALAADGDQITFDETLSGTTIRITGGEVLINKNLQIIGRGAGRTIISSAESQNTRVFTISPGIFASVSDLTLTVEQTYGGGIYTEGNLRVTDSVITGNYGSGRGGAIYNAGGDLSVVHTSLRGTVEAGAGAALYNDPQGKAYLQDCLIGGSLSRGAGVGIYNEGAMTITDTSIQGNMGTGLSSAGGGIANTGSLRIVRSVIAGNSAAFSGGIYNIGELDIRDSVIGGNSGYWGTGGLENGGKALLVNSTISGNSSNFGAGGISNGGQLVVVNSTVTGNSANVYNPGVVGGVSSVALAVVKNSVIAGNYALLNCPTSGSFCATDCGGSFASQGHNIIGALRDGCQGFIDGNNGEIVGVGVEEVLEASIGNNGGSTRTVALLPNSPARDAIPVSACTDEVSNPLTTDQRGVPRPQGAACDIGAFEFSAPRDTPFWLQQCREKNSAEYSSDQLSQFLATISERSHAFPECALATCEALEPDGPRSSWKDKAARELLGVWLNLASGRLTKGRPINLAGLTSSTTVGSAVAELEATICNSSAIRQDLAHAKDIAEALNQSGN